MGAVCAFETKPPPQKKARCGNAKLTKNGPSLTSENSDTRCQESAIASQKASTALAAGARKGGGFGIQSPQQYNALGNVQVVAPEGSRTGGSRKGGGKLAEGKGKLAEGKR